MPTNPAFLLLTAIFLLPTLVSAQSERKPTTHVQIVNATSVPTISIEVNGELLYPDFPQGKKTSDGATPRLNARYKVTDLKTTNSAEASFNYEPDTYYTLVITGDFSTESPPTAGADADRRHKPKVQFQLIRNDALEEGKKPRYRFINGLPLAPLSLKRKELLPGSELLFEEQPPATTYEAVSESGKITIPINQEKIVRNCTIIFYKSEKGIQFVRAFENSPVSERQRAALQ